MIYCVEQSADLVSPQGYGQPTWVEIRWASSIVFWDWGVTSDIPGESMCHTSFSETPK